MPPIIKQSAPHILISMIVAPIMLAIFAWAGSSIIGNREVTILLPTVTKQLDKISRLQHEQSTKQDEMMSFIWQNKEDVAIIKTLIAKDIHGVN